MKRIPDHILESINCGEADPSDYYAEYGEDNVKEALELLKQSDEEILNKISPEKFYDDLITKKNGHSKSKSVRFIRFAPLAAAAAFVLIFVPVMLNINQDKAYITSEEGVRIKGTLNKPELFLYRQTSGEPELLKNNEKVFCGDTIQIAYNPSGKKYCLIFSIDGNNQITNHLSQSEDSFITCEVQNRLTLLNYSYELDDAPDYELFVMVTADSKKELSEQIQGLAGKSVKYIQKGKYLPSQTDVTTFMLKKN